MNARGHFRTGRRGARGRNAVAFHVAHLPCDVSAAAAAELCRRSLAALPVAFDAVRAACGTVFRFDATVCLAAFPRAPPAARAAVAAAFPRRADEAAAVSAVVTHGRVFVGAIGTAERRVLTT
eukprot:gene4673-4050_t